MKYAVTAVVVFVVATLIFAIIKLTEFNKRKKNSKQYMEMLSDLYGQKSIPESLDEIKGCFKKKSTEYIAVDKAFFYLTQSIMRDYGTAFSIIEKVFRQPEIKNLHSEIMEAEKKNVMLMLQKPEDSE